MLSRRHLRTKVLQTVYAFILSDSQDLAAGEKQLLKSIDKLYELYVAQLSLLLEIADFARKRHEGGKKKYFPTQEDLNPNTKFVNNKIIIDLEVNKHYRKLVGKYKVSWADEQDMVRRLYIEVKESGFFQKYLDKESSDFEDDREVLIKIFKKVISRYEYLEQYYEDQSVFWSFEDFHTSNMMAIKTLKQWKETDGPEQPLPEIFKTNNDVDNEDRNFMLELFRKSVIHHNEYKDLIAEKAKNWELDRIAIMDILLINLALTEFIDFPSIPVKVTLNEYIEISKYYSSAKSKVFINGILDKLMADLKAENKINKMGRGLLEG
jgi:N utilization substance protein B